MTDGTTVALAKQAIALAVVDFLARRWKRATSKKLPPSEDVALCASAGKGKSLLPGLAGTQPEYVRPLRLAAKELQRGGMVGKLGKNKPKTAPWAKREDMQAVLKRFAQARATLEQGAVLGGTTQRLLDEIIAA